MKQTADLCFRAEDGLDGELFVMKIQDRLDNVRKRSVAYVVKKGGDSNRGLNFIRNVIAKSQLCYHSSCQVKRPKRMRKPGMLSCLIRKIRQPELADPAKPLKLRRVDQPDDKLSFIGFRVYANYIMNRIPVNSFRQPFPAMPLIDASILLYPRGFIKIRN